MKVTRMLRTIMMMILMVKKNKVNLSEEQKILIIRRENRNNALIFITTILGNSLKKVRRAMTGRTLVCLMKTRKRFVVWWWRINSFNLGGTQTFGKLKYNIWPFPFVFVNYLFLRKAQSKGNVKIQQGLKLVTRFP